jgi:hypothetical protein
MNRLSFVSLSAAATAALAFFRTVALGSGSAASADYSEMMTPLVATVVPIGSPGFPPITALRLTERIASLYHLDANPTFLGTLGAFCDLSMFAAGSQTLLAVEVATVGQVEVAKLLNQDSAAFRNSRLHPSSSFGGLSPSERRTYLTLWERSAFNTRRRFYGSARSVIFAALYSMPDSWSAIDYAGPLLGHEAPR